jgi:hypothetical protein
MNSITLKTLWTKNNVTTLKLELELDNRDSNDKSIKVANKIYPYLKQVREYTDEFKILDVLTVDNEDKCYYKQWQVQVYESAFPNELEYMLSLLTPNLSYNIIYNEEVENILDYYNLGNELRQMGFFSIEGNILYFNASVYIVKSYGETVITNPQAKLQIIINPFYDVKR